MAPYKSLANSARENTRNSVFNAYLALVYFQLTGDSGWSGLAVSVSTKMDNYLEYTRTAFLSLIENVLENV